MVFLDYIWVLIPLSVMVYKYKKHIRYINLMQENLINRTTDLRLLIDKFKILTEENLKLKIESVEFVKLKLKMCKKNDTIINVKEKLYDAQDAIKELESELNELDDNKYLDKKKVDKKKVDKKGYVYFIKLNDPNYKDYVKIGRSNDPNNRFANAKTWL